MNHQSILPNEVLLLEIIDQLLKGKNTDAIIGNAFASLRWGVNINDASLYIHLPHGQPKYCQLITNKRPHKALDWQHPDAPLDTDCLVTEDQGYRLYLPNELAAIQPHPLLPDSPQSSHTLIIALAFQQTPLGIAVFCLPEVQSQHNPQLGILKRFCAYLALSLYQEADQNYQQSLLDQLSSSHDALESKQQQLEEQNQQLGHTLDQLTETQADLIEAEKMASLGNLVAGISHEINTPIGVCLTAASSLQEKTNQLSQAFISKNLSQKRLHTFLQESEEHLNIVLKNIQRAAHLVKSFKQVSVDQSTEALRQFNLHEYLHAVEQSLGSVLHSPNYQLTINCPSELEMYSYPGSLAQIITHLITNSVTHGFNQRTHGQILIEIHKEGSKLLLCYQDDGHGLSAEQLKTHFDPFNTTRRHHNNCGLGTFIIYNEVKHRLQGGITCHSIPGHGVSYTLVLPSDIRTAS